MSIIFQCIIMFFLIVDFVKSTIFFRFKTEINDIKNINNYTEIATNLLKNKIYIDLNIGSPIQKINMYLQMEHSNVFIEKNEKKEKTYISNISSTSKYTGKTKTAYVDGRRRYGEIYTDDIILSNSNEFKNNFRCKNFEFIYTSDTTDSMTGGIGLQIPETSSATDPYRIPTFFEILKKIDAIEGYYWTLIYDNKNENEGTFVIGSPPHMFDPKNYDINHMKTTYAKTEYVTIFWSIDFDYVNFKEKITKNLIADIVPNLGVILGTYDFKIQFDESLKEYFDKNICDIVKIELRSGNYLFYHCDKYRFIPHKLPSIEFSFLHQKIYINSTDIWKTFGSRFFSLISFQENIGQRWRLGKPFLKKIELVLNPDSKSIAIYEIKGKKEESQGIGIKSFFKFILIIILIIVLFSIGIIIGTKILRKNRQVKANEIDDSYDYSNINNNKYNVNELINEFKKEKQFELTNTQN